MYGRPGLHGYLPLTALHMSTERVLLGRVQLENLHEERQSLLVQAHLHENDTLYVLEVHPAGYALIATNEAEKASNIEVLEFRAIGAFGRVYLGGNQAEIEEAAKAIRLALSEIDGRPNN